MDYSGYFLLAWFSCFPRVSQTLTADLLMSNFLMYKGAGLNQSEVFDSKIIYSECKCKAWCLSVPACMAYSGVYLDDVRVKCQLSNKTIFEAFPSVSKNRRFYASKLITKTHPVYQTNTWLESDGSVYWRTELDPVIKDEADRICSFHDHSNVPMILTRRELQAASNIESKIGGIKDLWTYDTGPSKVRMLTVFITGLTRRDGGSYWDNNVSYADTEISDKLLWGQTIGQNCFRFDGGALKDHSCQSPFAYACQMRIPKA